MEATEDMDTPDVDEEVDAAEGTTTPTPAEHPRKVSIHTQETTYLIMDTRLRQII